MNKVETKKLISIIKGYYNNQFFVDEFVTQAWIDTMEHYDLDDSIEHLKEYLKEYPDTPPKPHIFIKGMLTIKQKQSHEDLIVACQSCGKWLNLSEYDSHYDRCLTIDYLYRIVKEKGANITREELEQYPQDTIDKLYRKYEPTEVWRNIIKTE